MSVLKVIIIIHNNIGDSVIGVHLLIILIFIFNFLLTLNTF